MAGERMQDRHFREVSGVCTHPDQQGRGLARRLTELVVRRELARGETPFLHVVVDQRQGDRALRAHGVHDRARGAGAHRVAVPAATIASDRDRAQPFPLSAGIGSERVPDVEKRELAKSESRVKRVLTPCCFEKCRQVGVGHQVASHREAACHLPVDVEETLVFRQHPYVWANV